MLKTYHKAPLPFQGQKRNFLKPYKALLHEHIGSDGDGWTIIDAFGGSGLLAHVATRTLPQAHVIYNDYDGYAERLTHIADTNALRRILADILQDIPRQQAIPKFVGDKVKAAVYGFDGYRDVRALTTWLLFSGQEARTLDELFKLKLYNTIRRNDYQSADDYLTGLEIVKADFEVLLRRFEGKDKVLLVLDPPYVCTQQKSYNMNGYFGMVEFLRLMRLVKPPFIFFSSTRSELISYLDFSIAHKFANWQAVEGYKRIDIQSSINATTTYQDNMVYKF